MDESTRPSAAVIVLGIVLLALGGIGFFWTLWQLLLHGVLPLLAQHEAHVHGEIVRHAAIMYLRTLLEIVPGLAGVLLLARHSSARAWIVSFSVLTFLQVLVVGGAWIAETWRRLMHASSGADAWLPALSLLTILIAVLAPLVLRIYGERWLGPTSAGQWAFATVPVAVLFLIERVLTVWR